MANDVYHKVQVTGPKIELDIVEAVFRAGPQDRQRDSLAEIYFLAVLFQQIFIDNNQTFWPSVKVIK